MTNETFLQIIDWINTEYIRLVITGLVLLTYIVFNRAIFPILDKKIEHGRFKNETLQKSFQTAKLVSGLVAGSVLLMVWGVDISGLLLLSTSILTLTGVALFASWSLLSNVTSYFILLLHSSYRRGNFIRVIDADNYIEGYISDIGIFTTKLVTDERELIIFPNNVLLGKPTLINPRVHYKVMGKISCHSELQLEEKDKTPPSN